MKETPIPPSNDTPETALLDEAATVSKAFDFAALDALLGEETPESTDSAAAPEPQPEAPPAPEEAPCEEAADAPVEKKAKPALPGRLKGLSKGRIAVLAAVLAVILIAGSLLISAALDPFDCRMLANTTVGGINVGGMTQWQAYRTVKDATRETFTQRNMEVVLPDATITLSPDQTKAKLSIWPAIREAYRLGRKGTEEEKQAAVTAAAGSGTNIDLLAYLKLDQEFIRTQLENYAAQHNVAYSDLRYQLTGTQPDLSETGWSEDAPGQTLQLTLGTPLVELDVEAVMGQILAAYGSNTFLVAIDTIAPTTLPQEPDLDAIAQEFLVAPVNADADLENYVIVAGSYGYAVDVEAAKELIAQASYGETVSIPMKYITPEILSEGVYFRDELGYCETPHTNNENRNINLRLACEALDGHIIQPGEEFSYNGVLGERTAAKGYKPAPAYSGTDTVNSIGGGVCQGSSTLYYAALVADLEITERKNHGFRSTYIPIGLDATVSWWGPDFKFVNNYHFPIMIKAEVSDGFMKMWIYGIDEKSYYVVLESKVTGYSEAQTVYQTFPPDSGYYDGQVINGGTDGYYAQSFSCKYDKETDELISRDPIALSSYMRIDRVVAQIG